MSTYNNSSEWKYLFRNAINWEQIIPLYIAHLPSEEGIKTTRMAINYYEELISAISDWSSSRLAPRAKELDKEGAGQLINGKTIPGKALSQSYQEAKELGFFSLFSGPEYEGQGIPFSIGSIMFTQIFRACIPTGTQLSFFTSIADMIERFCEPEDKQRLIPRIISGELSGAMCLTEPGSGSDVGSLRTSATKVEDRTYLLNGSKIFITNGGGGVCLVLARIKDSPKGLAGLSLFLVEQGENNYRVTKIEDKMGFHGSFTCEVVFENSKAKLIGRENDGFKYMLHLMNEARLGVGLQCLGGMESCLSYAQRYAETRIQFGKPISDLPLMRRNLNDWQTELDAYRAFVVDTMSHYDIYQKLDLIKRHSNHLSTEDQFKLDQATKKVRKRTPLVKYYGAESFTTLSQKTIQVLGGYGYMQEYEAERIHRDSFGPLLYEGTSQIQSLMAMKDLIKDFIKQPTEYFASFIPENPIVQIYRHDEVLNSYLKAKYKFRVELLKLILRCIKANLNLKKPKDIANLFQTKKWMNENTIEMLMIHAETLTQGLAYIETLSVLKDHAKKDSFRTKLYKEYHSLITPRLEHIYADWKRTIPLKQK